MGLTLPMRLRAALAAVVALVIASLVAAPLAALADTSPVDPAQPATVSTDALPTVQVDGVVWSQVIVGNTVFVGGEFTKAWPAGQVATAANTSVRSNFLAYDVRTGQLIASISPAFNAQVRGVAASPDGSRVYAAGNFTSVNGTARYRVAAIDTATGALISSFAPSANTAVYTIAATTSTVYLGGAFTSMNNATRSRVAAVSASNGALLPWNPQIPDNYVRGIAVSPDQSRVVLAGGFTSLNGQTKPGRGFGAVDATTGASLPWAAGELIYNAGDRAALYNMSSDADGVYAVGYVFGSNADGNLEGTVFADWNGTVKWVQDCHGDSYSSAPLGDVVYVASHAHYCGNVGSFPQTTPWTFQRGTAFSKATTGTLTADPYGYYNFAGTPAPTMLTWYPDINAGTYTGQSQGAWSVAASGKYVVYGGEFTQVNGQRQQGLVRFAARDVSPNDDGPRLAGANFTPTAVSLTEGTARLSWTANYDRDNELLTYDVIRNGDTARPVFTTSSRSRIWFDRPSMGFVDTGLTPGQTYQYRLRATDPHGNSVMGDTVSVTISASGASSDYSDAVIADGAVDYWRLSESSGTSIYDWAGYADMTASTGLTRGTAGAIRGDADAATTFSGTSTGTAGTRTAITGPQKFGLEAWFRTTSTTGGKIVGFGSKNSGMSDSYDRHVYMDGSGRILFGVYPGSFRTLESSTAYNDGAWHHVVAGMDSAGMVLYVDGVRVGQRSDTTSAQAYSGYWRIGGDNPWTGDAWFDGAIDEVAVYGAPPSQQTVKRHYALAGYGAALPPAPSDAYGSTVFHDDPDLYWRLGETSGTTAKDAGISGADGTYSGGVLKGTAGGIAGTSNAAATFDGVNGLVASTVKVTNPQTYSEEVWFKSTSTRGGKLIGFGSSPTGTSAGYDRHVYLRDDGRLSFGAYPGREVVVTTPKTYNDGSWHHVVATQSNAGMVLYVDGQQVGSDPNPSAQVYDGYWRIGGDNVWGGASSAFVAASIDEAAVYGYALSADQVAQHYQAGKGVTPNVPPTAAFTASADDLAAVLDASESADSDGTISSYAWDFGDGSSPGNGVTARHSYAKGGTYTVTLTVTDDRGAAASTTRTVTVAAANAAPKAAFEATTSGLTATLDGSGSTDSDGSIASHSWNFGDGSASGAGATTTHAYASAGTYTVTLTVTDDRGATGTVTKAVTVTAPPAPGVDLAKDTFSRTVNGGLGSAETGGAWTAANASFLSVSNGTARFSTAKGWTLQGTLGSVSSTDTEVRVTTGIAQVPTAGSVYQSVLGRVVGSEDYRARVIVAPNGSSVNLEISRSGTMLQGLTIPGLTYAAGEQLQIRLQVSGTSPTTVRAKVWKVGTSEPASWQVSRTDSTAALQKAGAIGVGTYLSASATLSPTIVTFDDLWAGSTSAPPAPNAAPTASFTSTTEGLAVNVNGAGSSDSDGTISSHSWNWGDGTAAGTGATATHTYGKAGTYTVTLTVTDNAGATAVASKAVTVTAPPAANTAPQASFTSSVQELTASVDARGSVDPDGTITSYAWQFGDGATGTGATASHTYGAAGDYQVTLTVTDNAGATATLTKVVTVTAPPPAPVAELVKDDFNREVAVGLGTAPIGGAWTVSGSSSVSVSGGAARFSTTKGWTLQGTLGSVSSTDTEVRVRTGILQVPAVGSVYQSFLGRVVGAEDYRARVIVGPNGGNVNLEISRGGTVLQGITVPGLTYAAGDQLQIRLQVFGTNPTTVRAKVWKVGAAEPADWQVSRTDSTASLQKAGGIGIGTYLSASATTSPTVVTFDDLWAGPATTQPAVG